MHLSAPRRRAATCVAAGLVVVFAVGLRIRPGGEFATRAFDDVGEGIAAGVAAVACLWRAARSSGRWRLSWALIGAGLASWSAGEGVWSYYELISSRETPFPSLADAGYLLFPVFCLGGLFVRPSAAFVGRARLRVMLDGTMVVASLFILSWATALGAVYHAGAQNWFAFMVSLAYPASDLVLITVAVLVASRATLDAGLLLLVGGLTSMAVADSGFAYLVAAGTYETGAFTDIAWVAAFLAIGVSALFPDTSAEQSGARPDTSVAIALPYLLLIAGTAAMFVAVVRKVDTPVMFAVETAAIVALLLRQLIVVLDNRRLTRDVVAQQAELTFRAFHDPLTGVANRALFHDRVAHALDLRSRSRRPVSVVFVDVDDFKSINDAFGHDAGDEVLRELARRLGQVVRAGDTVARLGGDEFAVLLEDGDPEVVAARLLEAIDAPVAVRARPVPVRVSIGSATLDAEAEADGDNGSDCAELLRRADTAMYAAKRSGKGTAVSYAPGLPAGDTDDLQRRIALSADVRAGRIGTAFEPIANTLTGEVVAMEALARWEYGGAPVAPADFLPLAERGGFLAELDLLVARHALEAACSPDFAAAEIIVSTNLGLGRIATTDLPARLADLMREFAVPADRLIIEVSEKDDLDAGDLGEALCDLRAAGVRVAIDDFGVGYSTLARMDLLRPDIVKIDKSFVEPLSSPDVPGTVLGRVIALAHDIGAVVVAEGVETERQRTVLAALGCDAIQGLLVGSGPAYAAEVA